MSKKKLKYYGLSRRHTRKSSRDLVDFDYADRLDPKDREWLDQFSREYYQNAFKNAHDDMHAAKSEERRACYRRDHARRRDAWTQLRRMPHEYTDTTTFRDDEEK